MKRLLLISISILFYTTGFSQVLTIEIPVNQFRIDPFDHIIVVRPENIEQYTGLNQYEQIDLILDNFEFQFVTIPESLEYTGAYLVNNGSDDYHLFFTQLPLLKIQSAGIISSGGKLPAEFSYADDEQVLIAPIGINYQNSYLSSTPKKSYSIEFWTESGSGVGTNVQFGTMQSDDDYVLNSMYNDPLRIRTLNAHKIWLSIHQPSYLQEEPNALAGADVQYVEMFLNGHYSGIYLLSQQIERELLKLREYDGTIRGELYKGKEAAAATLFTGAPAADNESRYWAGHQMINPADTTNWDNIRGFTQFVLNSDENQFEDIWSKFDYQNYLDYFIFLNLSRTADNTGKNIYMAKYDTDAPYFYVPWQLNGSFGIKWNGTVMDSTTDILTNGFMDRVIDTDVGNYTADVNARWAELRQSLLNTDYVIDRFQYSYNLLKANNVYAREALVFPNYPFNQESLDYIKTWIQERMAFLDIYFGYDPVGVRVKDKTKLRAYPNPVADQLWISNATDFTNTKYQFFDIQGRLVKAGIFKGESISVSEMQPGFYFLKIGNLGEKIIIR